MKALIVLEVDFPNSGSWQELNETFTMINKIPYKLNSNLILGEDGMAVIKKAVETHRR